MGSYVDKSPILVLPFLSLTCNLHISTSWIVCKNLMLLNECFEYITNLTQFKDHVLNFVMTLILTGQLVSIDNNNSYNGGILLGSWSVY